MMNDLKCGRVPDGTGLSSATEPEVSALPGFDPSRMAKGLGAFSPDVVKVLNELGDGEYCRIAYYAAEETGVPEKRVKEVRRALHVLGFAHCGTLMNDEGAVCGRGYWASASGEHLRSAIAIAMEARQGGDGETRPHPKDDSAGPQDIAQPQSDPSHD